MTDSPTYKVNYILDAHKYSESSQKISRLSKIAAKKITFPPYRDGLANLLTDKVNYREA